MSSIPFGGNKICRCCLRSCENPHNIFDLNKYLNTISLTQCILEICNVQVSQDDNLPESICIPCYDNLKISYTFRLQVQKNNSFLNSILKEDLIEEEEIPQQQQQQQCIDNGNITECKIIDSNNECDDNLCNIEMKNEINDSPSEEYQISDNKYINNNDVILLNIKNNNTNDDITSVNTTTTNTNENLSIQNNNYITEYVNYIDHININNNKINDIKNFQCKLCNKKFKYSQNLLSHVKQQHNHIGIKQCQYCTKNYYKNYDLKRHIQIEHIKLKEYTCTICDKMFYTKSELNRHIKYHLNIKNYKCLQCEQKFYDKTTLDVHIRIVHLKEKNYICEICNKKFTSNSKVKRHQNSQICSTIATTKIISTINVGQHLVILDYDPNTNNNNNDNQNQETIIKQENLITNESINDNNLIISEDIYNNGIIIDQVQQITDPVQKFLN